MRTLGLLIAVSLAIAAPLGSRESRPVELRVLSYNLFLGADLTRVLKARSLAGLEEQVEAIVAQVRANDFVARADAFAELVAREQPDVLSLQEVALWRRDRRGGLFSCANPREVMFDHLAIVLNALARHRLRYRVAVVGTNEDLEAPTQTLGTVRLTDRNVLLVRDQLELLDTDQGTFAAQRERSFLGFTLANRKGWVAAVLRKDGQALRVVNTHLELSDPVRAAQVDEVLGLADATPTVWAGDFNTNPDQSAAMRRAMTARGVRDLWPAVGSGPASTCCQEKSLRSATSRLIFRADLILHSAQVAPLAMRRLGAERDSRARCGKERLWISDHAGVLGTVRLAVPPPAQRAALAR